MDNSNYLSSVRAQYELLPYPPVDPKDELKQLRRTWLEDLPMISHYCFGGAAPFERGFRALVAGGGTGDATIFLAEQLRHTDAEIVHLDLSGASIAIAQERAAYRGLSNIRWVQDSLLNAPDLKLGTFDYINCSGVLHHLSDPDAGLQALAAVLKPDGAMGIMVYGAIGRTGIYHMQEMLRLALDPAGSHEQHIAAAKDLLAALPPGCWLRRGADLYTDSGKSDADIYDMFLHSQDRAYTVEQLFAWLEDQRGFHITLSDIQRGRFPYLPQMALAREAKALRARAAGLPLRAQYAIGELAMGDLLRHTFYLTRSPTATARYGDASLIPFFFHEALTGASVAALLSSTDGKPIILHHQFLGLTTDVEVGPYASAIAAEIDGQRTFQQVFDAVRRRFNRPAATLSNETLFEQFAPSWHALNAIERLLLRRGA